MNKIILLLGFVSCVGYTHIIKADTDMSVYNSKTIAVYIGSFDPVHKGHIAIANESANLNGIDFVLMYPAPQEKGKKKNRAEILKRYEMLRCVFAQSERVIVTPLMPPQIQDKFRKTNAQFVAVFGEDGLDKITLELNQKSFRGFFCGVDLKSKKFKGRENTSRAALAMFRATAIVLAQRGGNNIKRLSLSPGKEIFGFTIKAILSPADSLGVSSTLVRKSFSEGDRSSAKASLAPEIYDYITKNKLYGCANNM